jgi:pyruvate/2-oxoacid:ferredoxin oxidoreductase beta subunit
MRAGKEDADMGNPFDTDVENAWRPGCGNFGILYAVKRALSLPGREKHEPV